MKKKISRSDYDYEDTDTDVSAQAFFFSLLGVQGGGGGGVTYICGLCRTLHWGMESLLTEGRDGGGGGHSCGSSMNR